jgi:hypothetical protein
MPSQFTINQILQFQEISQYLASNDKSSMMQLQSGSYIGNLPQLLYMEGTLLQNMNSLNPASSTLRGMAEYVLSLCGKYLAQAQNIVANLAGVRPVIVGPTSQSVSVGGNATFSVSVTGTVPYFFQWLLNGSPILGATSSSYTVANAQLSQTGNLYSVQVTNPVTTVTSNQVTLTVTANLQAFYYQGNVDYSALLLSGVDTVPYLGSVNITTGQPITITYPNIGADEYTVLKYPATEPTKTSYLNPPPSGPDQGSIPSIALEGNTFGGWSYVFSRGGNPFGLNSVNGQVRYS